MRHEICWPSLVAGIMVGATAVYLLPLPEESPQPGAPQPAAVPPGSHPGASRETVDALPTEPGSSPSAGQQEPSTGAAVGQASQPGSGTQRWPGQPPVTIQQHLGNAPTLWTELASRLEDSSSPGARALSGRARQMARLIQSPTGPLPPLQELVAMVIAEKSLLQAIESEGINTGVLGTELESLLELPEGIASPPKGYQQR